MTKKLRYVSFLSGLGFFCMGRDRSSLYSSMTTRKKHTVHVSRENLSNLPFKPCISENLRNIYKYSYNLSLPENEFSDCLLPGRAIDLVATNVDLYTIERKAMYVINKYKFFDKEGNRKIDVLDLPGDHMIVAYMARGFPLRDTLAANAQRFFENGLLQRHLNTLSAHSRSLLHKNSKAYKVFRLHDLRVHFIVLSFGIFVATFVLVIEILLSKTKLDRH